MTHPGGAGSCPTMVTNTTATYSTSSTMDSRVGLDYIVETPEYISKLAAVLDSPGNTPVKKQVFELLSALCVYNEDGYRRAIDTLECYRHLKGGRYRLQVIVDELDRATASDYRTALLAFINCLIISTGRLQDRVRLRNEFIACRLLTVLNTVRTLAENEPDLAVQLDVFDEQRDSDEQQNLISGLDLNSPLDVFYAVLRQVQDTPQEIPFLSILQHLLRIDPKEAVSDIVWDTAERLVHRATLLESRDEATRLLRAPSTTKFQCMHCHRGSLSNSSTTVDTQQHRKPSLTAVATAPPPPPPPPPAPPLRPCGPPPPPPSNHTYQQSSVHQQQQQQSHQQQQSSQNLQHQQQHHSLYNPHYQQCPMPPANSETGKNRTGSDVQSTATIERLPQQETPVPKMKMKTFNWNKIPSNKVIGRNNIWSLVADEHQHSPMADLDWTEMEGLFCQQTATTGTMGSATGKHGRESSSSSSATGSTRMRKDNAEVTLLDGKRSLNVNIFLKQFRRYVGI